MKKEENKIGVMIRIFVVLMICTVSYACRKSDAERNVVDKALAFVVQQQDQSSKLCYITTDGGSFGEVLQDDLGNAASNPAWSPDGRYIYFIKSTQQPGVNGVYSVKANGSELRAIYNDNADQQRQFYHVCVDHKNENVVFSLNIPRTGRKVIELYNMCPCGNRVVRLTQFETAGDEPESTEAYAGSFSTGDSLLVFSQSDAGKTGLKDVNIYTINIATKTLKRLVTFKATDVAGAAPSYSPTGGRMLLSIDGVIHTMNNDGSDLKPLATLKGYRPGWDRNGNDFYFSAFNIPGMEPGIYQSNISVTNIRRITRPDATKIFGGFSINL